MSVQTIVTEAAPAFTVRFARTCYHVLNLQGQIVSRYFFDADDFEDRRRAYRDALEDAEIRTTAAAQQAVNWGSEPIRASAVSAPAGWACEIRGGMVTRRAVQP